jgi:predicted ATPase
MIFEDVHWIDPTSLETLTRSIDKIKALSALLIVTFRPEFVAPWVGQSQVTSITLNRLGEHDAAAIVASLAGHKELSADVLAEIVGRTDGIPLFVEEMTKAVLEAENESDARTTMAAVASSVPASLHASLMARLDRLGAAKEVAQIGAVIGREFSYALLAAVVSDPEIELQSTLERVTAAGLLFRQGVPPNATYLFKHALIQDAAYGTLLRGPRRALHARIAETLENDFPDIAESQPELLARHCTEAGLIEKAAGLWGKAGQRSLTRSALIEAAAQFTRALAQIATLSPTPPLRREAIKLQVAFATVLFHVKGYTARETIEAFERANVMIEQAETLGAQFEDEDALLRFSVLYGQWTGNFTAGNFGKAAQTAKQFLTVAKKQRGSAPLLMAHRVMGASLAVLGEIQGAKSHLDEAVRLYVPEEHRILATRFGQDIGIAALIYRAFVLYRIGYPESALRDADAGLKSAREVGQAGTLAYALFGAGILDVLCSKSHSAEQCVDELSALSEKYGLASWKICAGLVRGWVFAATEKGDEAAELIQSSLSALANAGTTYFVPFSLMWLAYAHASCGRDADAASSISEAINAMNKTNERWDEAEIHRTAGEIIASQLCRDDETAESHFRRSLDIARVQNARSYELRAATSLARLWRLQGKPGEARDLLAPICGWFTEGFHLHDLTEAKALLQELQ